MHWRSGVRNLVLCQCDKFTLQNLKQPHKQNTAYIVKQASIEKREKYHIMILNAYNNYKKTVFVIIFEDDVISFFLLISLFRCKLENFKQ